MAEEKKTPVAGARNPFAKQKLPSARITWIQSYPRSGNAWVRAFLHTYMAELDEVSLPNMGRAFAHDANAGLFEALMREEVSKLKPRDVGEKRPDFLMRACEQSKADLVMRSHLMITDWGGKPTFHPNFSRAGIVVVRDPRDIALSLAADMELPVDAAIANMNQPQFALLAKGTTPQPIGSWTRNVMSWTMHPAMPRLVVRYEDMIANPRRTFLSIVQFMNLKLDFAQFDKALAATTFDKMVEAEKATSAENGRAEGRPFFRAGTAGQWREGGLTLQQIGAIEQAHAQAMLIHGYDLETVEVISAEEAQARQDAAAELNQANEIEIEGQDQ